MRRLRVKGGREYVWCGLPFVQWWALLSIDRFGLGTGVHHMKATCMQDSTMYTVIDSSSGRFPTVSNATNRER